MESAIAWLRGRASAMEAMLQSLVEVSSHTADKAGCDTVAAMLDTAIPLPSRVIASARYGDHRVFHNRRPASAGGVVLVGHLDTVFPRESFAGYRVDGELARGPGVLDMKGGLVVITYALRALSEAGLLEAIPLSLVVVSDEEVGSPDSAPHLRAVATGAAAALVFESGRAGDAIITRRKGTAGVSVQAHGKAAHAGNAHAEGANAIWALARFTDRAQSLTDYARGITVNVGRIEGGIGKNTVPDACRAEVDYRFTSRADGESVFAALEDIARTTGVPGTRLLLSGGIARNCLERTPASGGLRDTYARCQREAGLGDGEAGLIGGGSDASTTADVGVPSIDGLGPRGAGFHTVDERVERASLVPKAEALVRFLTTVYPVTGKVTNPR